MTAERASAFGPLAEALAGIEQRSGGQLRLTELPPMQHLNLRLDPGSAARDATEAVLQARLPLTANTLTATEQRLLLWLGPDEWLSVGPEANAAPESPLREAANTVHPDGRRGGSVVDVSATRTILVMSGPAAADLLAHGCALDLHSSRFGAGQCAQTRLALANVIICTPPEAYRGPGAGGAPNFWVFVRTSFAAYLATWLLDAAVELLTPAAQPFRG